MILLKKIILKPLGLLVLFLSISPCYGMSNKAEGSEIIFYRVEGGYSPYRFAEILIARNGAVLVKYARNRSQKDSTAVFKLETNEIDALKALVSSVNFFDIASTDNVLVMDVGRSTLRVSLDGKQRELHYGDIPKVAPLTAFLWKLINQGRILNDFAETEEVYNVLSAVSGNTGPARILQPKIYREPLTVFISTSSNHQKLTWAVEALAWITTPGEWGRILSNALENSEESHKDLLLTVLSTPGLPLPDSHAKVIPAILLKEVNRKAKAWAKLSKTQLKVYNSVVYQLGYSRYQPSVPTLIKLMQDPYPDLNSYLEYTSSIRSALPQMERSVLDPLESLLTNKTDEIRASAADILGETLDRNPNYPPIITPEDMSYILNRLRTVIAPKLEAMYKSDPSERARNAAKRSLDRIARGWNK